MAAAQLEFGLEGCWLDDVDDSAGVLLVTQTLQHQVVARGLLVLDQVVFFVLRLERERVGPLADFTLEGFPENGGEAL